VKHHLERIEAHPQAPHDDSRFHCNGQRPGNGDLGRQILFGLAGEGDQQQDHSDVAGEAEKYEDVSESPGWLPRYQYASDLTPAEPTSPCHQPECEENAAGDCGYEAQTAEMLRDLQRSAIAVQGGIKHQNESCHDGQQDQGRPRSASICRSENGELPDERPQGLGDRQDIRRECDESGPPDVREERSWLGHSLRIVEADKEK
jgi:hypothetical protein